MEERTSVPSTERGGAVKGMKGGEGRTRPLESETPLNTIEEQDSWTRHPKNTLCLYRSILVPSVMETEAGRPDSAPELEGESRQRVLRYPT